MASAIDASLSGTTKACLPERFRIAWAIRGSLTTFDTYTHSMRPDELPKKELLAVFNGRGEVLVRS
jgi:hypothetical protein